MKLIAMNKLNANLPYVTIGIPVTKHEHFEECLNSCIKQSFTNIEIIVVNNSLESKTKNKVKEITKLFNDERIRYIENEKQLPVLDNWNKSLSLAKGTFFSLLSDDDYYEENFLTELILLHEKYQRIDLFHSRVRIITNDSNLQLLSSTCPEIEDYIDFIYHRIKGWRQQFLSEFLVKTELLKLNKGFFYLPDAWGSDDITWFMAAKKSLEVAYCDKPLFVYRNTTNNISNSMNITRKWASIELYQNKLLEILNQTVEIKDDYLNARIDLIRKEIPNFISKKYIDLISRFLSKSYYVPSLTLPLFLLLFKIYKKIR